MNSKMFMTITETTLQEIMFFLCFCLVFQYKSKHSQLKIQVLVKLLKLTFFVFNIYKIYIMSE